eukprot:GHVN01098882.1.p1 GENE.GHVN01098882.1~~GHVN01098882.1.p1  ORF type:complete len:116 (-),score=13.36 GHVN01098882.1:277-624(-)
MTLSWLRRRTIGLVAFLHCATDSVYQVIEETNFCLGRVPVVLRHQATDDQARRVLLTIARQPNFMHTRLRDGTCIAPMHLEPWGLMQKPIPLHDRFPEIPLFKYTWDDAYDEMFE